MTTAEESKVVDAKVVLLGALGVGKTSLITRYSQKKFVGTTSPTIGASFTTLRVNVGDARVRIQLWDTAGQERFRAMVDRAWSTVPRRVYSLQPEQASLKNETRDQEVLAGVAAATAPLYYRKANAAIVAYDITSTSSFQAMKQWVLELRRNVEEAIVLVLVGNKCDLMQHRAVDRDMAEKYARDVGAYFSECSALSNEGIDEMFRHLALRIVESEEKAAASRQNHVDPGSIPTDPSLYGSLDTFTLSKTLRIDRLSSTNEDINPSSSSCSC